MRCVKAFAAAQITAPLRYLSMGDSPGPITRQRSSSRGVAPYEKPPALGRQRSSTDGLTGAIDQLDASLEEKPKGRAHRSSLADTAASRSARDMFKKAAAAPPPKSGKEVVQRAKFDAELEKFEKGAPAVGVASARGKAAMFEAAGKQPTAPAVKKTWASAGGGGNYKKKTAFEGGVAAKKTFADLP